MMWILDIEASGLHTHSYPIEIGITNGINDYCALIKPLKDWHYWDPNAETLHGIKRQTLIEQGLHPIQVCKQINSILTQEIVYSDCIDWDGFWLSVLFGHCGIKADFKLTDITSLLPSETDLIVYLDRKEALLSSNKYQLHRALDDAKVIHQSLNKALN